MQFSESSKKFSLTERIGLIIKIVPLLLILGSGYWAIYYEMFVFEKSFHDAFLSSWWNWIILAASILFEIYFLLPKKSSKRGDDSQDYDPWIQPSEKNPKPKMENKDSEKFTTYAKDTFASMPGYFSGRKIHVHFVRQARRVFATVAFFIFLGMAYSSIGNLPYFLFFLGTSYVCIDDVWKSRKIGWEKPKE